MEKNKNKIFPTSVYLDNLTGFLFLKSPNPPKRSPKGVKINTTQKLAGVALPQSALRALKHPRNLTKVIYIQMNENTTPPINLNFNQNKRLGSVLYKVGDHSPKGQMGSIFFNHGQF